MVIAVGADGYYPLGILSPCAGDSPGILPNIRPPDIEVPTAQPLVHLRLPPARIAIPDPRVTLEYASSMFWYMLCGFLVALCLTHAGATPFGELLVALYSRSCHRCRERSTTPTRGLHPYRHLDAVLDGLGPYDPLVRLRVGNRGSIFPHFLTACVTVASGGGSLLG